MQKDNEIKDFDLKAIEFKYVPFYRDFTCNLNITMFHATKTLLAILII